MLARIVAITIPTLLLMAGAADAEKTAPSGSGVPESIRYYEPVAMMSSSAAASQGSGAVGVDTMAMSFYTLGREFDLKLEMHDPFAPGALVRWAGNTSTMKEPAPHGMFWRGRDEHDPNSWVRLTLRDNALAGVVSAEGELYFLEPASRFFGPEAAGETVAYRLSDTDTSGMVGGCAARHKVPQRYRSAAQARAAHRALRELIGRAAEVQLAAAAGLKQADIGMVADHLYYNGHLAHSAADLAEVVNNVDGIYQSELGVTVQIKAMTIFTSDAADPFSTTNVPLTLLDEVGAWRDANDDDPSQPMWDTDLTHLFTGRDMQSNVIGIAYIGALCNCGRPASA